MTKKELQAIAEKYNMHFMRHKITREGLGVQVETDHYIPELDKLVDTDDFINGGRICATRETAAETILYRIYCPVKWIDLWGWK